MKKLFIILTLFAGVTLSSCKKFLTADSPSLFTPEYVFGSETDANQPMPIYLRYGTMPIMQSTEPMNVKKD